MGSQGTNIAGNGKGFGKKVAVGGGRRGGCAAVAKAAGSGKNSGAAMAWHRTLAKETAANAKKLDQLQKDMAKLLAGLHPQEGRQVLD